MFKKQKNHLHISKPRRFSSALSEIQGVKVILNSELKLFWNGVGFWNLRNFPTFLIRGIFLLVPELIKGTVSVISSDPQCKDSNAWFTTVPLKLLSHQNMKDTLVFMTLKVFDSDDFYIVSYQQEMCKSLLQKIRKIKQIV